MIKYIDDGQIARLKRQFFEILNLKKLEMMNAAFFINSTASLDLAIRIYRSILSTSVETVYSGCSSIMLDYLLDNHILRKSHYETIKKYFYDDSNLSERDEEDVDCYYDAVDERMEFTDKFIEYICSRYSISVESRTYEDLYYESDIDDPVFGDMTKILVDYSDGALSEDNEKEDYFSMFQDDAICYALIGYEMTARQLNIINRVLITAYDSGVATEAYVEKGNTYITLSFSYIFSGQGYTFFAALIILLLEMEN